MNVLNFFNQIKITIFHPFFMFSNFRNTAAQPENLIIE